MKLHLSTAPGAQLITGYGSGYVTVNGQRYEASLIVLPERVIAGWAVRAFGELKARHLGELLPLKPEIVLLGTGARQRFPAPALLADLIRANVGLEVMDTQAACRTYNILVAEGRRVAAALIIEA
ncbi:MAG: Mth938-like domain-containing protein [Thiobacillaceae bacterium]